ncbi:MAG: signal peptidase II [Candidatus Omnitrophica bacterium]|nr:signal peptidase II [Candidatus Omnitrophota bacterium]
MVIFVLFGDQYSKHLALVHLSSRETFPLIPDVFHLTLVHNKGIAFGIFRQYEFILRILITLSIFVLLFIGWRMCLKARGETNRKPMTIQEISMALILGGALGNWIDRLRFGAVIDFLDFRIWPVFNLADTAITIGVGLYMILLMKGKNT